MISAQLLDEIEVMNLVNSHYVPQLILRHFSENEIIQYCDINGMTVEYRNIKTVFSEKGYYPDQIEGDLAHKIEVQFANILNKKILPENYKVTLTREELTIVKKYLIITTIRYNITEQIRRESQSTEEFKQSFLEEYNKNFYENINKILQCEQERELFEILKPINLGKNPIELFSDVKNILHSYIVIVSTNRVKENFIIPDVGYSWAATNLSIFSPDGGFDKCMYTLNKAMQTGNPYLFQVAGLLTPYEYIICPISKDKAIISLSVFYKFFNRNSDIYGLLPTSGLVVSELLGFGNSDIVEPPKIKQKYGSSKIYEYGIKQLSKQDIYFLNGLMINMTDKCFGFYDFERVRKSVQYYNEQKFEGKTHDLSFLLEKNS